MQQVEKSSLYDRFGGVYSIATVVNDFINIACALICWNFLQGHFP
jgi:hypothetical protein